MGEWQAGWWGAWCRGSLRGPKAASATHRGVASPQPGPLNFLLTWGSSCQCLASSNLRVKLTFPHLPFKPPDLSLPPSLKETSLSVSLWPSNNPEHTPLLTLLPHLPPLSGSFHPLKPRRAQASPVNPSPGVAALLHRLPSSASRFYLVLELFPFILSTPSRPLTGMSVIHRYNQIASESETGY